MAKIYKLRNDLVLEYKSLKGKIKNFWFFFLGFVGVSLLLALLFNTPIPFGVIPIVFLIVSIISRVYKTNLNILEAGILGEQETARLIKKLPDSFYAFQNLKVTFDGKSSEIDLVLVGPTGVFVIEIKNLNGRVVGSFDKPRWSLHKIGRGGTPYKKDFYSPVKQVGTHVYRLANTLRKNGIKAYVNSCVFFSNEECVVHISGSPDRTPVFDDINALFDHILSFNGRLSNEEIEKIRKLLLGKR